MEPCCSCQTCIGRKRARPCYYLQVWAQCIESTMAYCNLGLPQTIMSRGFAGNAPWQCQYCQANMQLFSHKSRHDCPFMVAKDYVCIAVALPRILAYIRSVTFRLSVILCCQPCMHHAVLFCRPDKEHATTAQIIAMSKQMARDAPSTSFPPAKQRVQLAQRRRAPISM